MGKGGNLGEFEQLVLLALIRLRDNAYGVTIRREIEKRTGRGVSIGAIYTTLDRMVEKGYVSSHMGDPTPERGGRAKRFITITAAGANALQESLLVISKMRAGLRLAEA